MTIATMLSLGETALKLGLICSLTVLALFLSYSMLNVCRIAVTNPDVTPAAMAAAMDRNGCPLTATTAPTAAPKVKQPSVESFDEVESK